MSFFPPISPISNALCGMGATQSWVTELCHCLTQVCRKRRLEKGWTNGTSVTRSSSRCEGFVSGSHIFFIVNETLKQNLQSCESLNDLKCVDGTINPIQFNSSLRTLVISSNTYMIELSHLKSVCNGFHFFMTEM